MSDFMRDDEGALRCFADILGQYRPALIIEDSAGTLERRIAGRKPRQFKLEMLDGGIHKIQRLLWDSAASHLTMQALRGNTNRFERIHL